MNSPKTGNWLTGSPADHQPIPPETEYYVSDLEELVNAGVTELLRSQPFSIEVRGLQPRMRTVDDVPVLPPAIEAISRDLDVMAPGRKEFTGMNLSFSFPIPEQVKGNPFKLDLNWTRGKSVHFALTSQGPILHYAGGTNGLAPETRVLDEGELRKLLNGLGLPYAIWGSDFTELFPTLSSATEIGIKRSRLIEVDSSTTLDLSYVGLYRDLDKTAQDDAFKPAQKDVVQELTLAVNHLGSHRPDFRNSLRFARDAEDRSWQYRGTYAGRLYEGDLLFVDDQVQIEPKLVAPSVRMLEKTIEGLRAAVSKQAQP